MNVCFAQYGDGFFAQPTHVVGKRINAAGEVTRTLESDFSYNELGKVVSFVFPQYSLSSAFLYDDDFLLQEGTKHLGYGGYGTGPYIYEFIEYSYNDGKVKHIRHSWSEMNAPENWEYSYDEYGRLKQKDYDEGYDEYYHEHYIYDYENEGKTKTESYCTSWVSQGWKLRKKTINQYDDDFHLISVHTQSFNLEGEVTGTTLVTYTYTPSGKEESQIKQTLVEEEWRNTSIQRYIYDEQDRVIERQNGSWSAENDDWNINKKITFAYEPQEEGLTYIVSFYKKSGEEWVWDVFSNQTILFGSQLKLQQKTLRFYVSEGANGAGRINQFEITFSVTPEPVYQDIEENEALVSVYPNPTTGQVTITGKDLKKAEVVNTLGQRVAAVAGEGERITVDINRLPAGVYFVNVTDKDGRKCVRKVVKE